jgi:hypothetical protein
MAKATSSAWVSNARRPVWKRRPYMGDIVPTTKLQQMLQLYRRRSETPYKANRSA